MLELDSLFLVSEPNSLQGLVPRLGLFSDYVSTQMAEGRDESNNHQLHVLYCGKPEKRNKFTYTVLGLPVFTAMLREV